MFTQQASPRRRQIPVWLITVLSALAFALLGAGGLVGYRYFSRAGGSPAFGVKVESAKPATVAGDTSVGNLILENLEVTGLRLTEDAQKKLQVQFLVVNHSPAPLTDVAGTVTLRPSTAKVGGGVVGVFAFRIPQLDPYGSREMKAPLEANMRIYELPDWQFLRADIQLTSPK